MRLFVPDEPDTVENNIQYRALGRSFYRCLREFDLADLHSQVHDEAVDLLEDILMVLDDPDLDDAHCLDEIVLLYQRRLGVVSARHEKRVLKRLQGRDPDSPETGAGDGIEDFVENRKKRAACQAARFAVLCFVILRPV